MHSPLNAYLDRLRVRLGKNMSPEIAEDHVQEIRAHLVESAKAVTCDGTAERLAEIEALKRIGSDRALADNLIRASSGIENRSAWRWALLPMVLFILAGAVPLWFEFPMLDSKLDHIFDVVVDLTGYAFLGWCAYRSWRTKRVMWPQALIALLTVWAISSFSFAHQLQWYSQFALLAFIVACSRSRKILVLPMAAAAAFVVVHAVAFQALVSPWGFSRLSEVRRQEEVTNGFRHVAQMRLDLSAAMLQYAKGLGEGIPSERGYLAPRSWKPEPFFLTTGSTGQEVSLRYTLLTVNTNQEARQMWQSNGQGYLLQMEEQALQSEQGMRNMANTSRETMFTAVVRWYALVMGLAVLLFGALNFCILGLHRMVKRVNARLWHPERL